MASAFVCLCYAELAALLPVAGNAYTYATPGGISWIIGWDLVHRRRVYPDRTARGVERRLESTSRDIQDVEATARLSA